MSQWGGVLDHASPRHVSLALQAGSELLASSLTLPVLSRHACSARFSSLSWFSASSWWTTNTSSLTGARGRAWVDVSAPPNTSCGLLSTGSSDWEQTLWLGKARRFVLSDRSEWLVAPLHIGTVREATRFLRWQRLCRDGLFVGSELSNG